MHDSTKPRLAPSEIPRPKVGEIYEVPHVDGTLVVHEYVLGSGGSLRGTRLATYEEAREHELFSMRGVEEWARLAAGESVRRPRSPAEREDETERRLIATRGLRRENSGPGPFDDVTATRGVFVMVREFGAEGISLARGLGADRSWAPEMECRSAYASAGLLALWLNRWPTNDVPEELRGTVPPRPADDLASLVLDARNALERVGAPESPLRVLWEDAPDGGAAFRSAVDRLRAALADER